MSLTAGNRIPMALSGLSPRGHRPDYSMASTDLHIGRTETLIKNPSGRPGISCPGVIGDATAPFNAHSQRIRHLSRPRTVQSKLALTLVPLGEPRLPREPAGHRQDL